MTTTSDPVRSSTARARAGRDRFLGGVDWREVAATLLPTTDGPITLQRAIRDASGQIVDCEILLFLGDERVDRDLVEGMRSSELNADWDADVELEPVRRALETGRVTRHAVNVVGFEHEWFLLEINPLVDDLLVVTYSDLDEAHGATQQLRSSIDTRSVPDRPEELCVVSTPTGRLLHMSTSMADLLGWSVAEMMETGLTSVLDVDVAAALITSCARLAAGSTDEADTDHALVLRCADGRRVHTKWTVRHVPEVGIVAIGGDVTGRVEAERELRSVLDAVGAPVVLLDERWAVFTNRAWDEFTGLANELERDAFHEWHRDDREALGRAVERARRSLTPTTVEARLRRHDGERRWMHVTISPVDRDTSDLLVALVVDVHDRRIAEIQLGELTALVPDIVFRIALEPSPHFEYVSPAYAQLTGIPLDEHYAFPEVGFGRIDPDGQEQLLAMYRGDLDDIVVRMRPRDGDPVWLSIRCHHDRDDDGRVVAVSGIARDVTDLKRIEDDLEHRATHDALTGLPNRALLAEVLGRSVAQWRRQPDRQLAVLFLDLDRFKLVNDTHGHDVGDELLVRVADRLRSATREGDTIARLGGDEFAVLIEADTISEVVGAAERVLASLDTHLVAGGYELYAAASGGLAFAGAGADRAGDLLRHADTALARAKDGGRNRLELFDDRLRDELERRHRLEQQLRAAVDVGEIDAHFQPIVDLVTGRIVAVEALARWTNPDGLAVPPATFIPLAEETGVITTLGTQMLKRSLEALAGWHRSGHLIDLSVNLSARTLSDDGVVDEMPDALAAAGIEPQYLCVEVTETLLVSDGAGPARRLARLREHGIRIAVDDFGTGFSSLSYLDRLPLDILKVDRSFVARFDQSDGDPRRTAIARSIVDLAAALGLEAFAEGIETEAQRRQLIDLGCRRGQGYLFSAARTARQIDSLLPRSLSPVAAQRLW